MTIRAILAWFFFASLLLMIALSTQDLPFEPQAVAWSFVFAFPAALSVMQGGLGHGATFQYPSAALVVLGMWIGMMAPSFVLDHPDAHKMFGYSDGALTLGRSLFFLWCTIFAIVSGRVTRERIRLEPRVFDVVAVGIPVATALSYLVASGQFSNYGGGSGVAEARPDGGVLAVSTAVGSSAMLALPAFLLMVAARARSVRLRALARACFAAAWVILFLSGGRRSLAYAAGVCFFIARGLGLKFRPSIAVGVGVALPVAIFLAFTYRGALQSSNMRTSSFSDFMGVAMDATETVVIYQDKRSDAVDSFSDNAKLRLWYGPQFFAVVDLWTDTGAAFRGTFLEGLIRTLPSWFFPAKNQLADQYAIEPNLIQSGRFPDIDLAPTPWMQWLYELGFIGIVLGASLYGRLVRWIDIRVARTASIYEALFWIGMLPIIAGPEHTTDSLVQSARNLGFVVGSAYLIISCLNRVFPSETELQPAALPR
jgi:hypothetical protein